jgi:hypothetical protein
MNDKQEYYVGLVLSYILGILLTPIFFAFIGVVRILLCVVQILWDAFLFTPRVVTAWQVKCWEKQSQSEQNNTNLN